MNIEQIQEALEQAKNSLKEIEASKKDTEEKYIYIKSQIEELRSQIADLQYRSYVPNIEKGSYLKIEQKSERNSYLSFVKVSDYHVSENGSGFAIRGISVSKDSFVLGGNDNIVYRVVNDFYQNYDKKDLLPDAHFGQVVLTLISKEDFVEGSRDILRQSEMYIDNV